MKKVSLTFKLLLLLAVIGTSTFLINYISRPATGVSAQAACDNIEGCQIDPCQTAEPPADCNPVQELDCSPNSRPKDTCHNTDGGNQTSTPPPAPPQVLGASTGDPIGK